MKSNLKIVFIISSLLVFLSISISLVNFMVSLEVTQKNLKDYSLPLSIDNIYSEIQTQIIKPNLVSSMMAHDTFVKDWLLKEENNSEKIERYLQTIKNKYGMFVTFLVSDKTKKYYTQDGFLEVLDKDKSDNQWYYRLRKNQSEHEINLDYNKELDNALIMFINYKIFDANYQLIGVTGIGLKIFYINDMLKRFRENYKFTVYFIDNNGDIILSERGENGMKNLRDNPALEKIQEQIISKNSKIMEYSSDEERYLITTKYIQELDLYLVVEAKVDDFMQTEYRTFYMNLLISLFVTLIVTLLILYSIRGFNRRVAFLADHDSLTDLLNRRSFNDGLARLYKLHKRNHKPLSFLFFDIDNFKAINDTFGHSVGDEVLKRIAGHLKEYIRETDLVGRWGGEEFIVALIDTDADDALAVAEKLRIIFEEDIILKDLINAPLTASFGVTEFRRDDTLESVIVRVDDAMYQAKAKGKNRAIKR